MPDVIRCVWPRLGGWLGASADKRANGRNLSGVQLSYGSNGCIGRECRNGFFNGGVVLCGGVLRT